MKQIIAVVVGLLVLAILLVLPPTDAGPTGKLVSSVGYCLA
jgi:hypothetical protein